MATLIAIIIFSIFFGTIFAIFIFFTIFMINSDMEDYTVIGNDPEEYDLNEYEEEIYR